MAEFFSRKAIAWLALTFLVVAVGRIVGASDLYQNDDQTRSIALTGDVALNHRIALPRDNEGYLSRKPPMLTWVGAFLPALGFWDEWALKFPSMLATAATTLLCLFMTGRMARRLADAGCLGLSAGDVAAAAGIAFLANASTVKHFYFLRPDSLNVAFLTGCWVAATLALDPDTEWPGFAALIFWLCAATAALTKGATVLIPIFYALFGSRLLYGGRSSLKRLAWWWGLPLAAALCALWVVPVLGLDRRYFCEDLVGGQMIGHITGGDPGSWLSQIPGAIGRTVRWLIERFFPWSVPAVLALGSVQPRNWSGHPFAPAALAVFFLLVRPGKFRLRPQPVFIAGFACAVIFVLIKVIPMRDEDHAGDRIKTFAREARAIVKADQVAFIDVTNNPVITLMARCQPSAGTPEEVSASAWVVRAQPVAESAGPDKDNVVLSSDPLRWRGETGPGVRLILLQRSPTVAGLAEPGMPAPGPATGLSPSVSKTANKP